MSPQLNTAYQYKKVDSKNVVQRATKLSDQLQETVVKELKILDDICNDWHLQYVEKFRCRRVN